MSDRRITLEGPVNWRDLGGYPAADGATTAWGRLYRSDSTHRLTADDVPVLRELGIRTAIDFRSAQELDELGIGPLGEAEITHIHTPTFQLVPGQGSSMNLSSGVDFYTSMIEAGAHAYVAAANEIAREEALPAVFSCMAGKDRTGVFAAIVLGLLGVPDAVIVEDYVLTHEVMPQIAMKRVAEQAAKAATATTDQDATGESASASHDVSANRWAGIPEELLGAHAFVMEGLIDRVRSTWGGWDEYAASVGFPAETVAALRTLLLDP